jgi:hypothetical protein
MVSAWPEPPFARLADVCVGMEALALRGVTIERRVFLYCGSRLSIFNVFVERCGNTQSAFEGKADMAIILRDVR